MTTSLQSTISTQLGWTWRDQLGTGTILDSNRIQFSKTLTDGSGSGQSDAVWHAHGQTRAAGQSTTLFLDALEQEMFGDIITVAMARVKAIHVVNSSTSGGYLLVGGTVVDEWHAPFGSAGNAVKVMPDSPLLLANPTNGWSVGFGYKALKIAAVGDPVTYDAAIVGVLAGSSSSSSSPL